MPLRLPSVCLFDEAIPSRDTVRALLPYLLDFRSPATRRDVLAGRAASSARAVRKSQGVYFTPGDVAEFMVRGLLCDGAPPATWLDPAVGTGVFLRQVLASDPRAQVYGIDIDPAAAEMAAFVLLAVRKSGPLPISVWHELRSRLATGDALMCLPSDSTVPIAGSNPRRQLDAESGWRLGDAFPDLASGVDAIIQNPPYAPPPSDAVRNYVHRFGSSANNIYPLFVRLGLELLGEHGRMSVVTPASLVTSSVRAIMDTRKALAAKAGDVEILTYDRAPDGLFGDDVKTRCSIVFLDRRKGPSLRIGPMQRITSRDRSTQLSRGGAVAMDIAELAVAQPAKIATDTDRALLRAVRASAGVALQHVTGTSTRPLDLLPANDHVLALGPTAYNWLNVQLAARPAREAGHDSSHPFLVLETVDAKSRNATYAVLSSRVAYWCWRVFGDGFHVSRLLIGQVPMPGPNETEDTGQLAKLGEELWRVASAEPVRSHNGGRTTVAFPPRGALAYGLLDEIDRRLLDYLKLSDLPVNLAEWTRGVAAVGREEARTGAVAWSAAG